MNRDLRRRIQKAKISDDLLHEILVEGRKQALSVYTLTFAMALHDKLDFGQTRVQRFLNEVSEMFDSVINNYVTLEDYKAELALKGITFDEVD